MVAGVTAGQAKITVVPDLGRFASDLRSKLRDIESTVKATITANLKLDTAEARTELDRFASQSIDIVASVDTSRLVIAVHSAIADAQHVATANPIKLQTTLEVDHALISTELASIRGADVKIKFDLDIEGARAKALIFKAYLDALFRNIKIKIELDDTSVAQTTAAIAALAASLRGLGSLMGNLGGGGGGGGSSGRSGRGLSGFLGMILTLGRTAVPNFSNSLNQAGQLMTQFGSFLGTISTGLQGLGGFLGSLGTQLQGISQNLGPVGQVLGVVVQAIAGLAVAGIVAIGISLLVAVLSNLVGAALIAASTLTALTAGIVGFGAVLAAVIIGSQGVGTAIGLAFGPQTKANVDKLKAALKDLTPNAKSFVLELAKLHPALSKLADVLQQQLFRGLSAQIATTAQVSLPGLTAALNVGAREANNFATQFLKAFQSPSNLHDILATVYNLLPGMNSLAGSLKPLITGFLDLSKATSGPLNGFLRSMGIDLGNFGRTLTNISNDPKFVAFLNQAFTVLGQIGSIVKDVVRSLSGIATGAASGGTSLKPFADTFKQLADFINSPAGQKGLADFFKKAQDTVTKLTPAIKAIGQAFKIVADIAVSLAPSFASFVSDVLPKLVNGFQSFWNLIKPFAPLIAGVLVGAIIAFIVVLGILILPFVAVGVAIAAVGAGIAFLVIAIINFAAAVPAILGAVGGFFATLWSGIVVGFQFVVNAVSNFVVGLATAIGTGFMAVIGAIGSFFATIGTAIANFVMTMLNGIKQGWTTLTGITSAAWNVVVAFIRGAINGIVSGVTGFVNSVISFFGRLGSGIKSAVSTGINAVVGFFQQLPGRILGILNGLISSATNAGRSIVQGIANGIKNAIGAVTGAISDVMSAIAGFLPHSPAKIGPLSGGGWSLFSGQAIGDSLAEGIASRQAAVADAMNTLLSPVTANASNSQFVGSALVNHTISLADQNLVLQIGDKEYNANLRDQLDARDVLTSRSLVQGGPRGLF